MESLNYLRKASEYLRSTLIPSLKKRGFAGDAVATEAILTLAHNSEKFILPEGGRIFDDRLRGLPDKLTLPFPSIVIEYTSLKQEGLVEKVFPGGTTTATKRIVVALQQDDRIKIYSICSWNEGPQWGMQPWYAEVTKNWDGPMMDVPEVAAGVLPEQGKIPGLAISLQKVDRLAERIAGPGWQKNAYYDMLDEINAVLSLIEALACSNVGHEVIRARKPNKGAMKHGALPFDDYRVLVIKQQKGKTRSDGIGSHDSPREHLRRGHIRRLPDKQIWVNPCVVNPGIGAKVDKQYNVQRMERAA